MCQETSRNIVSHIEWYRLIPKNVNNQRQLLKSNLIALAGDGLAPLLSGVPDYFYRNKISSGGDLSHYSSASLY